MKPVKGAEETRGLCSNCGASLEPAARLCPNCGADLQAVWPPPPKQEKPRFVSPPNRLLTGRNSLDGGFGIGLFGLCVFGLIKAFSLFGSAYTDYAVRTPLSQKMLSFDALSLMFGIVALIILVGVYLGLRHSFPTVGRAFGQQFLLCLGVAFVLFLALELLR